MAALARAAVAANAVSIGFGWQNPAGRTPPASVAFSAGTVTAAVAADLDGPTTLAERREMAPVPGFEPGFAG
jgi:hypothetical protein